ncbi:MAG: 50S ribosomal protein L16 [Patescibacteria group bacterium]|nr:50S ribosomal protein L16 [Patescibacteria group bacterium]MBU1160567.1 50S ribosomal protein L16 [Patescibacteria group bacterium]MBU1349999.1 50S ribosomal protein L16 [Patescibacteria group bacterium]MBU1421461.1 50S ribosomal protein L16 [Patescibacteria group bacterium]MBU1684184.1 50S ribosomal protein L16 [Patescibacteria group bacterium]
MLMPKKTKYRKSHKGKRGGKASGLLNLSFGSYGLKSMGAHWVTSRQIEAARKVITKYTKKGGRIWIRIFPAKPVTSKGGEMPMGKGKGAVDHYVVVVKPGMIMFEMDGVEEETAKKALNLAAYKLPVKCIFVSK